MPAAVGVPEMTPLAGLSPIPGGSDPTDTFQTTGGAPPWAARVRLYGLPTVPRGSDVVVTLGGSGVVA